ncbi:MAG: alpha/beta hydrolase [Christensenellales bacterium]|jgi:dipeptidyl aminopeptidase/acylaminoacyl peptidase
MYIFVYIIASLAGLYLLLSLAIAVYIMRPLRRTPAQLAEEELGIKQVDPALYEIPFEELWLKSDFGYDLYGRFYKANSNKYVLLLHGHNSASSGMVRYLKIFYDRGYNVVIPDHRYSARSGGKCITYGYKEKLDAVKFIEYIKGIDKDAEIGVMGESMGAATAIMLTAMMGDFAFCIGYCGYADIDSVMRTTVKSIAPPLIICYPTAKVFYRLFTGISLDDIDVAAAAKDIACPTLILHSKGDKLVSYSNHKRILDNLKKGEHVAFEASGHGLSINTYPLQFTGAVNSFLDKIKF